MEIEAKFDLVDAATEQLLVVSPELGPFRLGPAQASNVVDHYLDTDGRDCLHGGYTCRLRASQQAPLVTFKAVEDAADDGPVGTFRREEIEQELPVLSPDVDLWPDGPARLLAARLCGDRPLLPLLSLKQIRCVRSVFAGTRCVGALTVDRVSPAHGRDGRHDYRVVEFELGPAGTDTDLENVSEALGTLPGLTPATVSKLARGLALLRQTEHSPSPRSSL